jgi:molecular chaperone GrpE
MRRKEAQEPQPEQAQQKKESAAKETEKSQELEELRRQLADLQKERDELFARLQRLSADYANFQKRAPKQVADTIAYEKERIMRTLLPVLDNFEHTFQKAHLAENVDAFVRGLRIIHEQILDVLKSHGIEQINALGKNFDPALHEAVLQRAESQEADNVVLEEFQKGYKLNGRVIRPTKVIVNKLTAEQPAQQLQAGPEEQTTNQDEAANEGETNTVE